ncbi:MAG: hypothetical protein V1779_03535 [bacterium]
MPKISDFFNPFSAVSIIGATSLSGKENLKNKSCVQIIRNGRYDSKDTVVSK